MIPESRLVAVKHLWALAEPPVTTSPSLTAQYTAPSGLDDPEPKAGFCSYSTPESTEVVSLVDAKRNAASSPSSDRLESHVKAFPKATR